MKLSSSLSRYCFLSFLAVSIVVPAQSVVAEGGPLPARRVAFAGAASEHKWSLAELNPELPADWTGYQYLVLELKASSPQRFVLSLFSADRVQRRQVQPLPNVWIRAAVPLQYFRQPNRSGQDLASVGKVPRPSFWISTGGTYGPLDAVTALGVGMQNALGAPTLEIRSVRLAREDPGSDVLDPKPVVDVFGQWMPVDWPGKVNDLAQLQRAWAAEAGDLRPGDFGTGRYGGYLTTRARATGFFRVEQVEGRWWFVDPEGHLFFSTSATGIGSGAGESRLKGREDYFAAQPPREAASLGRRSAGGFYSWNLVRRHGADVQARWVDLALQRLDAWGLNTIGNWSDSRLWDAGKKAYQVNLGGWGLSTGYLGLPDVYAEEFVQAADRDAAAQCAPRKNDPWLLGYFIANEPAWPGREAFVVDLILERPASAIQREARAWLAAGDTPERRRQFVIRAFEKFLEVTMAAIRRHDPNHLILGLRFGGHRMSPEMLRACRVFDVYSLNVYANQVDLKLLAEIHQATGRPILIGEFHFGVPGRGLAPGLVQVRDQAERGVAYRYYVEQAAAFPALIGTSWFQWVDQPCTGRMDGENYNIGLVDVTDRPYPELIAALRATHQRLHAVHAGTSAPFATKALAASAPAPLDRHALVSRHHPQITRVDPWAPLSVGNGRFAFTADATGLQTLSTHYHQNGIPLETLARWAWHSNPNPDGYKLSDANVPFTAYGKTLGYPTAERSPAGAWLRENPHDLPLPQLALARIDGPPILPAEVSDIAQTLDLWTGLLTSGFTIDGRPVKVTVACHPTRDVLAVRVESPLLGRGKLAVRMALPRGHDIKVKNNPALDWTQPESHETQVVSQSDRSLILRHTRDDSRYFAAVNAEAPLRISPQGPHAFRLGVTPGDVLEFTVAFGVEMPDVPPTAEQVRAASRAHWPKFWATGGAIDFSGSKDPRAAELERRVVLSQYLTAIQFAGDFPPQESGLTNSTWFGKHHTEMVWWHTAHFALWGRHTLLAKNLDWFVRALPIARDLARSRELRGARWAKMIGPDGRESPGGNPLIVWNQPHPIHLAELLYRNAPTAETLARYRELVLETADCMATMLHWDEAKQRYNLGPPLWIAQEIYDRATSMNPTYELSYWVRGLKIAQEWRERLKLGRDPAWDHRIGRMAALPIKDGKYVAMESTPDTWENKDSRHDHPSFLMALGQLPGDGVDGSTMRRTLDAVISSWDWETKIWGWDYPMVAMTAARLGAPQTAVDILLFTKGPNNAYAANGHCPQRGDLPVYLPANGALLAAVAMMAVGWDGAATRDAPGFPRDGSWVVRSEGLRPLP